MNDPRVSDGALGDRVLPLRGPSTTSAAAIEATDFEASE
jgi:hypothetical protein